jgi:hypothetical protein
MTNNYRLCSYLKVNIMLLNDKHKFLLGGVRKIVAIYYGNQRKLTLK